MEARHLRKVLQGQSYFLNDLTRDFHRSVLTKRSPLPHAKIRAVHLPELPPDVHVISSADIPGKRFITVGEERMPILADGEVRYIGEPVLLLVGPDPAVLARVSENILIQYEDLPAWFGEGEVPAEQVVRSVSTLVGQPEEAFAEAATTGTDSYTTGPQEHSYSEPQGCLISVYDEGLSCICSTRWPWHVHRSISAVTGLPLNQITVEPPTDPDTSLDGKVWYPSLIACQAAIAARRVNKTVRFILEKKEDFLFTSKRAPITVQVRSAFDSKGTLTALDLDCSVNLGAWPLFSDEFASQLLSAVSGLYRVANLRARVRVLSSNLPPLGIFAGFGQASILFALEKHITRMSAELKMDPVALRLQNAARTTRDIQILPIPKTTLRVPDLLQEINRISDFSRKHAAYKVNLERASRSGPTETWRGIGLAIAFQTSGLLHERVYSPGGVAIGLRKDREDRVSLSSSIIPSTGNLQQIWRQTCAGILGLSEQAIHIETVRTSKVPDTGPSLASRGIGSLIRLVASGALALKKRGDGTLPLNITRHLTVGTDQGATNQYSAIATAAAVVEVEVDRQVLQPRLRGIWLVVDAGTVHHKEDARATLERTAGHAIGWTTTEQIRFSAGSLNPEQFATYRLPMMTELCVPHIVFLDPAASQTPTAAGLGEIAFSCIPGAYTDALSQALGTPVRSIPPADSINLEEYFNEV